MFARFTKVICNAGDAGAARRLARREQRQPSDMKQNANPTIEHFDIIFIKGAALILVLILICPLLYLHGIKTMIMES